MVKVLAITVALALIWGTAAPLIFPQPYALIAGCIGGGLIGWFMPSLLNGEV